MLGFIGRFYKVRSGGGTEFAWSRAVSLYSQHGSARDNIRFMHDMIRRTVVTIDENGKLLFMWPLTTTFCTLKALYKRTRISLIILRGFIYLYSG